MYAHIIIHVVGITGSPRTTSQPASSGPDDSSAVRQRSVHGDGKPTRPVQPQPLRALVSFLSHIMLVKANIVFTSISDQLNPLYDFLFVFGNLLLMVSC